MTEHRYRGPEARGPSLLVVLVAYVAAGAAMWWGASPVGISSPYGAIALGYGLATVVIFASACIMSPMRWPMPLAAQPKCTSST